MKTTPLGSQSLRVGFLCPLLWFFSSSLEVLLPGCITTQRMLIGYRTDVWKMNVRDFKIERLIIRIGKILSSSKLSGSLSVKKREVPQDPVTVALYYLRLHNCFGATLTDQHEQLLRN